MNFALILAVTGFLFLKTGEKFATQESAGPTLQEFTAQLGADYDPRIFNEPLKAAEYVARAKPALGIVTPGFYLTYAKALGMTPLLEVKRQNVADERYVLVAPKSAPDDPAQFAGKRVATPLAAEQNYVLNVVLQKKLGDETRLQPVADVEGAAFDLADASPKAPDAVLMEEATWKVLAADPELAGKLKVVFTSDVLPGNLVVTFPSAADPDKLKAALQALPVEVRGNLRVAAFTDVHPERLKQAEERFHAR